MNEGNRQYLIAEIIKLDVKINKYETVLKRILKNYPIENVDYIPITELYEIHLMIKGALK